MGGWYERGVAEIAELVIQSRGRKGTSLTKIRSSLEHNSNSLSIRDGRRSEPLVRVASVTRPDLDRIVVGEGTVSEIDALVRPRPLPRSERTRLAKELIRVASGAGPKLESSSVGVDTVGYVEALSINVLSVPGRILVKKRSHQISTEEHDLLWRRIALGGGNDPVAVGSIAGGAVLNHNRGTNGF